MTIKEAIELLDYEEDYYIVGTHSGKVYYKSYKDKKSHLEKFLNEQVSGTPFFTDVCTKKIKYGRAYIYPIIGIWMSDYHLCHPEESPKEET